MAISVAFGLILIGMHPYRRWTKTTLSHAFIHTRATTPRQAQSSAEGRSGGNSADAARPRGRGDRIERCLLLCMSPQLAPNRPAGMSALWSLSGAKRTWLGLAESTRLTQMYGPAVRRKRISSIWRMCGLASMYPASDWSAFVLPAIMDISARAISLPDRPRTGHLGHQCSHVPGRPILHLVSSSRRPRRVTGVGATSSIAPHLAQFLCSCLKAVPSSRPAGVPRRRAQGPARLAVALLCLTFWRCQATP